ncbi:MAG: TauD/TfdA family dioxygenase [Nitriliruptoraceae bacterium]|nr:TauD/TfdA family dioxygenase [Nitriliruptoraceae bacterium]
MHVLAHDPIGATVLDLDLDRLDEVTTDRLKDLLATHGMLAFPDQELDDARFTTALRRFGALTFTTGETPVPGHPDLNVVSNVGRTRPPRSSFHVDTSYVRRPPAYTALRAVQVPDQGGATMFTDQQRALRTLPDELRRLVEGRTITHVVTGLELDDDAESHAEHPIVRPHPRSGERSLYLTTPPRCAAVSGLEAAEAVALIDALFTHSTRPDNLHRHAWSPGDVVIWDNARVLHAGDHTAVVGDRVMHRGMVAADGYDRAA